MNSKLPDELYAGFLTPCSVRADLNYMCAWVENRGHSKGPECKSLEHAEAKNILNKVSVLKNELIGELATEEQMQSIRQDPETAWKNLIRHAHEFRQTGMRARLNGGTPQGSLQFCSKFMNLLGELGLISK